MTQKCKFKCFFRLYIYIYTTTLKLIEKILEKKIDFLIFFDLDEVFCYFTSNLCLNSTFLHLFCRDFNFLQNTSYHIDF